MNFHFLSFNQILFCFNLHPLPFSCHCAPLVPPCIPYLRGSLKTCKGIITQPSLLKAKQTYSSQTLPVHHAPSPLVPCWYSDGLLRVCWCLVQQEACKYSHVQLCVWSPQTLLWKNVLYPGGSSPPVGGSYCPVAVLCTWLLVRFHMKFIIVSFLWPIELTLNSIPIVFPRPLNTPQFGTVHTSTWVHSVLLSRLFTKMLDSTGPSTDH